MQYARRGYQTRSTLSGRTVRRGIGFLDSEEQVRAPMATRSRVASIVGGRALYYTTECVRAGPSE